MDSSRLLPAPHDAFTAAGIGSIKQTGNPGSRLAGDGSRDWTKQLIRFVYRDLVAGRVRVALSVAAIASVVVLVTVFEGFKSGPSAQVR